MIGFATLSVVYECPAGGCPPINPIYTAGGLLLPSGLTLAIAGIVVLWVRRIEINREEQASP